tara:strand:- start:264 stop:656 length:393 start_codon:yes stop_codon:yes gene_type:complete
MQASNAQENELFLYVAEDATYAAGSQRAFRASDFIGAHAVNGVETKTIFHFKELDTHASTDTTDSFTLVHTANAHVEVMQTIGGIMSNPRGGFVTIHDFGTGEAIKFPPIKSTGTAVTLTGAPVIVSTEA